MFSDSSTLKFCLQSKSQGVFPVLLCRHLSLTLSASLAFLLIRSLRLRSQMMCSVYLFLSFSVSSLDMSLILAHRCPFTQVLNPLGECITLICNVMIHAD